MTSCTDAIHPHRRTKARVFFRFVLWLERTSGAQHSGPFWKPAIERRNYARTLGATTRLRFVLWCQCVLGEYDTRACGYRTILETLVQLQISSHTQMFGASRCEQHLKLWMHSVSVLQTLSAFVQRNIWSFSATLRRLLVQRRIWMFTGFGSICISKGRQQKRNSASENHKPKVNFKLPFCGTWKSLDENRASLSRCFLLTCLAFILSNPTTDMLHLCSAQFWKTFGISTSWKMAGIVLWRWTGTRIRSGRDASKLIFWESLHLTPSRTALCSEAQAAFVRNVDVTRSLDVNISLFTLIQTA